MEQTSLGMTWMAAITTCVQKGTGCFYMWVVTYRGYDFIISVVFKEQLSRNKLLR